MSLRDIFCLGGVSTLPAVNGALLSTIPTGFLDNLIPQRGSVLPEIFKTFFASACHPELVEGWHATKIENPKSKIEDQKSRTRKNCIRVYGKKNVAVASLHEFLHSAGASFKMTARQCHSEPQYVTLISMTQSRVNYNKLGCTET